MAGAVRHIGGVKFISTRPGTWISAGDTFAIVEVFKGTKDAHQWELYRMGTSSDGSRCEMHDLIDNALTMGELCYQGDLQAQAGVKDGDGPQSYEDWLEETT